MASKKSKTGAGASNGPVDEKYAAALEAFTAAVESFGKGDYRAARDAFEAVAAANRDEIELCAKARAYVATCERRLEDARPEPDSPEAMYYRAVILLNDRELDEAHALLDRALAGDSDAPQTRYARASVRALQGNVAGAAEDLRHAVRLEPAIRFQAVNDPDFDGIRDEAAFIDIVEPTPSEA